MNPDQIRDLVRDRYGAIAAGTASLCCAPKEPAKSSCCGGGTPDIDELAKRMGYGEADLKAFGDGANLGLGCGNPQAIADLRPGEVVVDLGAGAGFDCFLAARQVGASGRVIGVDMTHEMLNKARANSVKLGLGNVEFRLGEIEYLPVADGTADVIISNCVINLSPDKPQVLREAFRVLKPGGRLAVSDVVMLKALTPELATMKDMVSGCIAGAATVDELTRWLGEAGFTDIRVEPKPESRELIREWAPGLGVEDYVASAVIQARKAGPAPLQVAGTDRPLAVDASGASYWAVTLDNVQLTCFEAVTEVDFPIHSHPSEQITHVVEGELTFTVDERTVVVGSGGTIAIPANVPHSVKSGPQGAKAFDAWSPPMPGYR